MNVLIVVPTYNERENLPALIHAVVGDSGFNMIVVDDDSPDGTGDVAEACAAAYPGRVRVLHRTEKRGLGRSYVDGFRQAVLSDADLICQMDADLSHDPQYLPEMVAAAEQFDVVVGSRYVNGISVVNWPLRRIILSSFANGYVRAITGLKASDCTSGFRCWRRDALARIDLDRMISNGYAFQVEMLFEAARRGYRIGEVPITFIERENGASKLGSRVLWESAFVPWRLRLARRGGRAGKTHLDSPSHVVAGAVSGDGPQNAAQ